MSKSQQTDGPNYDVQIDADDLLETLAERAAEHARKMYKHRRDHREYDMWWEREPGQLSQYMLWELEELGALRSYSLTITHLQPEASHSWRCEYRNDDGTVDVRGLMQWLERESERAHEDSYGPHSETRQADAAETAFAKILSLLRDEYGVGWPRFDELGGVLEGDLP